jgi:hypothetical protein
MQVGAIIPIHSYLDGAKDIANWCIQNYPKLFSDYKLTFVSDLRSPVHTRLFDELSKNKKVECIFSDHPKSLKHSLIRGIENLGNAEIVNIIEADAIPKLSTLAAMLEVYESRKDVGAVGCMFSWKGKRCYPTHFHWYTDALFDSNFGRVGEVREVGKPGIPFLFSLWKPEAISIMKKHKETLPDI